MPGVFISYAHEDKTWVNRELLPRLRMWGIEYSIDRESFLPGQHLTDAITEAVAEDRHVLFVTTPAFSRSEWSRRELQDTIARDPAAIHRKAIPIILDDEAVPEELQTLVWCNLASKEDR